MVKLSKLVDWFKSYNRKRNQAAALGVALSLLIGSWLNPPWIHYNPHAKGQGANYPHGWFFVFDTKQGESSNSQLVMSIDFGRLILLDAIIVGIAGAMTWAGSRWRLNLLAVALSIMGGAVLVIPVAISCQVVATQIEQSKRDAESRVENVQQARAMQVQIEQDEQRRQAQAKAEQERQASQVLQDDRRKIEVLDCFFNSDIRAVEGRIMNRLQRRIRDVALKLSFYDYVGGKLEVVDVEHVVISGTFTPEETKSFSQKIEIPGLRSKGGSEYVPGVWLYTARAEVTNAYYED